MTVLWEELTMADIESLDREGTLLVLPVGSIEGHGSHLPVGTDWQTAISVVDDLADRMEDVVVLPGIPYGLCSSTRDLPGTISLSFDTIRSLVGEVLEGVLSRGFRRILVLSSHAGRHHMSAIRLAAIRLARQYDVSILVVSDYEVAYDLPEVPDGDGHGGMVETSRMIAIRPELVGDLPGPGHRSLERYVVVPDPSRGFPQGYIGDPASANGEYGREFNRQVVDLLVEVVQAYRAMEV